MVFQEGILLPEWSIFGAAFLTLLFLYGVQRLYRSFAKTIQQPWMAEEQKKQREAILKQMSTKK
ncbi:hypothetical protein P4637_14125 [Halalkalibacterium halodurans]|uniref:BH1993 protein n=1 Tax=Halalkalibacterium halodurans (strain ATCC BAA-125 / DSM 18197 / FERM 7344 / JCM 9153 / C-125) TaxID=272558 RepID=Q9KBD5_HALH5|nr:hypothetical protein [Halalkalibacterium halodurans]MDY7222552.1 hypothetical protein [Halalkalibacterium halodurans]MDY7241773.1 hypothetical protein [Halalkalibacterium halodurans]MED4082604.1 hypothetical protein [Halalkalibacterium halodurans]MED4085942.1 hypothetical protein [Halalkalibacterium halodurans]MED4104036.1 hypothetical protein [Halalkalibacterium halodurans]